MRNHIGEPGAFACYFDKVHVANSVENVTHKLAVIAA